MKNLIIILFTTSFLNVQGQELDPQFYLFGSSFDYTIPTYPGKRLEREKINICIHQSDTGMILRLSEVTGLDYKKRKSNKNCRNCDTFYELKNVPWRLSRFYNFNYIKDKGTRPKKVNGTLKSEMINNASFIQMNSFLAGLYLLHGSLMGDTIKLQFGHINQKLDLTKSFIESIDGAKYINIIPVEEGTIGGGPLLIFVPTETLKEILLNEEKRKNTLNNKTYKQ